MAKDIVNTRLAKSLRQQMARRSVSTSSPEPVSTSSPEPASTSPPATEPTPTPESMPPLTSAAQHTTETAHTPTPSHTPPYTSLRTPEPTPRQHMKRTQIYLRPDQMIWLDALAKQTGAGVTRSDWVRYAVDELRRQMDDTSM